MLSLTDTTELTRAERYALRIARHTGSRFPVALVAVLAVAHAVMFIVDHDVERFVYRSVVVVFVAVMEWEHIGFSQLLHDRDEEIRHLDAELHRANRVGKVGG